MNVTLHVAQNDGRRGGSAIDARTTWHAGYSETQKKRKRIEECFGWLKDINSDGVAGQRISRSFVDGRIEASR